MLKPVIRDGSYSDQSRLFYGLLVEVGQGVYVAGIGVSSDGAFEGIGVGLSPGVDSDVGRGNVGDTMGSVVVGTLIPMVAPGATVGLIDSDSQKYIR